MTENLTTIADAVTFRRELYRDLMALRDEWLDLVEESPVCAFASLCRLARGLGRLEGATDIGASCWYRTILEQARPGIEQRKS